MKILFFIGNGFDLNIGMKTRYADFYKYFQNRTSDSSTLNTLIANISENYKNWSDLELALGRYTNNVKVEDFDLVFEHVLDSLGDYLESVENSFDLSNLKKVKLYNYFCKPEDSLPKADQNAIKKYKDQWQNPSWNVHIITFNYTRTLEKIIDNNTPNAQIGSHHHNRPIILKKVEHIHGFTDERMVMGVNDISQISNTSFHTNRNILDAMVKSNCNKVQKHTIDDTCRTLIQNANLICIFGSSIGETDDCWWEAIGEHLKKGCRLIIFTKGEEISRRFSFKIARIEREMKDYFLDRTKLTEEEKMTLADNIYVGVNSKMFSDLQ